MQIILLKTHLWNKEIEKFAEKIKSEIAENTDFVVVYQGDQNIITKEINVYYVSNERLRNVYQTGYISPYFSNHWVLMDFYKNNRNYQHYWCVEYDVRIVGNSKIIWDFQSDADFLFPIGNKKNPGHKFGFLYSGKFLEKNDFCEGMLQIARYSNRALEYLDRKFLDGESGQDEMIIFSLMRKGNFKMSCDFLGKKISGMWNGDNDYIEYNKNMMISDSLKFPNKTFIYHPIK